MKWLYRILRMFVCPHRWRHMEQINVHGESWDGTRRVIGFNSVLQCQRCGTLKIVRIRQ